MNNRPLLTLACLAAFAVFSSTSHAANDEPQQSDIKRFLEFTFADSAYEVDDVKVASYPTKPGVFEVKVRSKMRLTEPLFKVQSTDPNAGMPADPEFEAAHKKAENLPDDLKNKLNSDGLFFTGALVKEVMKKGASVQFTAVMEAEKFVDNWRFKFVRDDDRLLREGNGDTIDNLRGSQDAISVIESPEHKALIQSLAQRRSEFKAQVTALYSEWDEIKKEAQKNAQVTLANLQKNAVEGLWFSSAGKAPFSEAVHIEMKTEGPDKTMVYFRNNGSMRDYVSFLASVEISNDRIGFALTGKQQSSSNLYGPVLASLSSQEFLHLEPSGTLVLKKEDSQTEFLSVSKDAFDERVQPVVQRDAMIDGMFSRGSILHGFIRYQETGYFEEILVHIDSEPASGAISGRLECVRNPSLTTSVKGILRSNLYANDGPFLTLTVSGLGYNYEFENDHVRSIFRNDSSRKFDLKAGQLISDGAWNWILTVAEPEKIQAITGARDDRRNEILKALTPGNVYQGNALLRHGIWADNANTQPIFIRVINYEEKGNTLELEFSHQNEFELKRSVLGLVDFDDVKTERHPIRLASSGGGFSSDRFGKPGITIGTGSSSQNKHIVRFPEHLKADLWIDRSVSFNLMVEGSSLIWDDVGEFVLSSTGAQPSGTRPSQKQEDSSNSQSSSQMNQSGISASPGISSASTSVGSMPVGNGVYGSRDLESLGSAFLNTLPNEIKTRLGDSQSAAGLLGQFASVPASTTSDEYKAQQAILIEEASANEQIKSLLPSLPSGVGAYALDGTQWSKLQPSAYRMKQGLTDMLSGKGRIEMVDISPTNSVNTTNPVFLFHHRNLTTPPCIIQLQQRNGIIGADAEKTYSGGAWVKRANWLPVRLSALGNGWFILESLTMLEQGIPYALCITSDSDTMFSFKLGETASPIPFIQLVH